MRIGAKNKDEQPREQREDDDAVREHQTVAEVRQLTRQETIPS